jgi:putative membrane protein
VRLLVRLLASAVALAVAAGLVDGISVGPGTNRERALTLLGVAIIFGLVNAIVRPILRLLTLPLVVLTLGLFLLVLNALMLLLTEWIANQFDLAFHVDGFWSALLGALIITLVSFLINILLPDRYER